MILASRGADVVVHRRAFELSSFIPHPGSAEAISESTGRVPALSVPAVAAAVRLVSESIASFVLRVYEGPGKQRQPRFDAWQAKLFQDPAEGWTSFDVWSDTFAAIELTRHAFIWKVRTQRQIGEIYPIDPDFVRVTRKPGQTKVIEARIEGRLRDITRDVVHIRGWAPGPAAEGIAVPELHRRSLRLASSFDEFRGRFFANDAMPGILLHHSGNPTKDQRREIMDSWVARHAGPTKVNRPGMTWGPVEVKQLAPSMRDSQGSETADSVVRDIARMFRIFPPDLLLVAVSQRLTSAELISDLFLRFSLLARMRRFERALAADRDLFPNPKLYPRWDPSEFIRGDITTTASMVHQLKQVGVLTANEGRAELGLPPMAGGDVLQITPVGGAENPDLGVDDDDGDDDDPPAAAGDDQEE